MKFLVLTTLLLSVVGLAFSQTSELEIGAKAPSFTLKNIDGETVSLNDMDDVKGVILIFTCNHCPYAIAYEDRIIELDAMYREKGYPVVAIMPNDTKAVPADNFENMQARAEEKGFTFPYLLDATQDIAKAYGATRTPHVYVLERVNGQFVNRYVGAIDDNHRDAEAATAHYVQDAVNALLKGKAVPKANTRAIGCTIKWASR